MKKISYYFLLLVTIYLPFQSLLTSLISANDIFSASNVFWLTHWYEPVLIAVAIFLLFSEDLFQKISKTQVASALLIIFGVASVFLLSPSITRGVEGFRFSLLAVLFFLFASRLKLKPQQKQNIINIYIIITAFASLWALAERLAPLNYWNTFGASNFGWGNFDIVGTYQSSAFFAGPNQLASYILPAIFMLGFYQNKDMAGVGWLNSRYIKIIAIFIMTVAVIVTFSRSALVGLVLVALIVGIIEAKKTALKVALAVLPFLLIVMAYFIYQSGSVATQDIFTHGASHSEHLSALSNSLAEIKYRFTKDLSTFIFGKGIGTAGPAVLKYGDGIISESWYIQVILELGLFGFLFWIWFQAEIFISSFWENRGLFYGFCAVSIAAIFLHTWADNPALAITVFMLAGAILGPGNLNERKQ